MKENNYDDPVFFEEYNWMSRSMMLLVSAVKLDRGQK